MWYEENGYGGGKGLNPLPNSGEKRSAYSYQLDEFERTLSSISEMVKQQERFVSDDYRDIFLNLLQLIRIAATYDVGLARAILKHLIEASIVLLTERDEEVDIKIIEE
ncbi:MAG: hypothetical protein QXX17_01140 [Conexivisphaerales archaeon]